MMSLKDKRNKILHRREKATKDDADQCFSVASELVQNSARKLGELYVVHPQHRLLGLRD